MTALPQRLHEGAVLHLPSDVTHARRGNVKHAFRYSVDYVLFAPETARPRGLFGRNRFNLFAVHDRDHGGERHQGTGALWAWDQFAKAGLPRTPNMVLGLLTQPRFLGYWFNPVSFWMLWDGTVLRAVIAEVNNTFGQRHSYLCKRPDLGAITGRDQITTTKVFHVSPFQDVSGRYDFRFDMHDDQAAILIRQVDGDEGLVATMRGQFAPITTPRLLAAAARRPGGALRVLGLIYWHALRLKLKGLRYRPVPTAPEQEISQ